MCSLILLIDANWFDELRSRPMGGGGTMGGAWQRDQVFPVMLLGLYLSLALFCCDPLYFLFTTRWTVSPFLLLLLFWLKMSPETMEPVAVCWTFATVTEVNISPLNCQVIFHSSEGSKTKGVGGGLGTTSSTTGFGLFLNPFPSFERSWSFHNGKPFLFRKAMFITVTGSADCPNVFWIFFFLYSLLIATCYCISSWVCLYLVFLLQFILT